MISKSANPRLASFIIHVLSIPRLNLGAHDLVDFVIAQLHVLLNGVESEVDALEAVLVFGALQRKHVAQIIDHLALIAPALLVPPAELRLVGDASVEL